MKNTLVMALVATSALSFGQFDFESVPYGSPTTQSGTLDGVNFTISASGGGNLTFTDTNTAIFGDVSGLHAYTADWIVVDFASAMSSFALQMGDFNQDIDDFYLEAYSLAGATGSMLDSDTANYLGTSSIGNGSAATLSVADSGGFLSVRFRGIGGDSENNYYYDNFRGEAVPEPATLSLLGLGALAFMRKRSK